MKLKLNSNLFESIFLIVVFFTLLLAGVGVLWDHKISHEFPYSYLASDAFQDLDIAQNVKDSGNYRYYSISGGIGNKDVVGQYVPILFTLPVLFSYSSGLEVYDSIYLMMFLLSSFGSIMMYLLIRKFNKSVAILSLPLSLFLFNGPFYVAFTWGQWGYLLGSYFLIAAVWAITKLEIKYSFILLGVILSGNFHAHPSEAMYIAGFGFVYLFFNSLMDKKINLKAIKNYLYSIILFVIISFNYIIIFKNTFFKGNTGGKLVDLANPTSFGWKPLFLSSFDFLYILIIIGVLISLFFIKKKNLAGILLGWFMLVVGYTNYLGGTLGSRSMQSRFFWPIYLGVFVGLLFYVLLKFVFKKRIFLYSILVSLALLIAIFNLYTDRFTTPGIMNQYNWESLDWIKKNAGAESKILFFYSDVYTHNSPVRQTNKSNFLVKGDYDFYEFLMQNRSIKRKFTVRPEGESSNSLPKRLSFFKFEERTAPFGEYDICKFNYFVLDILPQSSRQPYLIQANNIVRSYILDNDIGKEVFNNQVVSVIKNEQFEKDCLPENGVKF